VKSVARRVHHGERSTAAEGHLPTLLHGDDAMLVDRGEPAVHRRQVAVDGERRLEQARRLGQMPGASAVHVHDGLRKRAHDVTDPAAVVQVDVGEDDLVEVVGAEPVRGELADEAVGRCLGSRLDERRALARDEIRGGEARLAGEHGVEERDAGSEILWCGWGLRHDVASLA